MPHHQLAHNAASYDNYKSLPTQHRVERNGRAHDDRYSRSDLRDQPRRSPSPPRRYASPHGKPY